MLYALVTPTTILHCNICLEMVAKLDVHAILNIIFKKKII